MKTSFFLAGTIILAAGMGCKKGNPVTNPPTGLPVGEKWVVTTIAGDGTPSFANGPVSSAEFHFPFDVAVAADGTLYVTDNQNHSIRKIAGGQVSTFAGSDDEGFANGIGTSAQFRYPYSIALDAAGNIYSTEVDDPRIRKTSPAAEVSTYAGQKEEGFADGDADTARFREETGIATDLQGNIYIADPQSNRIRKISVSGKVTTLAGSGAEGFRNGNGASAQFNFAEGIAVDKQGNVYVADGGNDCIRKITSDGQVTTLAGSAGMSGFADGNGSTARFEFPMDMVIDGDGNLYVIDISRIRKITPQGMVSTIAGSTDGYADGDGATAKFYTPSGLGIDTQGNIYVADTDNNRIRKISHQ